MNILVIILCLVTNLSTITTYKKESKNIVYCYEIRVYCNKTKMNVFRVVRSYTRMDSPDLKLLYSYFE